MRVKTHSNLPTVVEAAQLRADGLSQRETADVVGVARRTVQRWEANPELWAEAEAEAGVTRGDTAATGDIEGDTPVTGSDCRGHLRLLPGPGDRKTSRPTPQLRTPSHGNGKLQVGNPGNRGGPGVPSSELRERLRGSMEERVAVLEEIADDTDSRPADRIRAIELLAKYGLGTTKELSLENVRDRLVATIAIIGNLLPETEAEAVLVRMREVWR